MLRIDVQVYFDCLALRRMPLLPVRAQSVFLRRIALV